MPGTQISAVQIKGYSPRSFTEDKREVKKTPLDKEENSCTTEAKEQGKEQRDKMEDQRRENAHSAPIL